jgi:hypothetical protein
VEKYYRVAEMGSGKEVVVVTRRGRRRVLAADDPALRRARWWERLWFRQCFPTPAPPPTKLLVRATGVLEGFTISASAGGWSPPDLPTPDAHNSR